jgi:hypothetical protein
VLLAVQSLSMSKPRRKRVVTWVLACAAGLADCAVWAADPPEKVFDLRITSGALPAQQRVIRVTQGDRVIWRITSDAPGRVHVHAYRLETNVLAGQPAELAFQAFATGRYRVEWHPVAANPATPDAHHAPPLATLEVRPP